MEVGGEVPHAPRVVDDERPAPTPPSAAAPPQQEEPAVLVAQSPSPSPSPQEQAAPTKPKASAIKAACPAISHSPGKRLHVLQDEEEPTPTRLLPIPLLSPAVSQEQQQQGESGAGEQGQSPLEPLLTIQTAFKYATKGSSQSPRKTPKQPLATLPVNTAPTSNASAAVGASFSRHGGGSAPTEAVRLGTPLPSQPSSPASYLTPSARNTAAGSMGQGALPAGK
jgi:hypothetical protein